MAGEFPILRWMPVTLPGSFGTLRWNQYPIARKSILSSMWLIKISHADIYRKFRRKYTDTLQALTQHTQKLIINKKSGIKDSPENEFRDKGFSCQHQTNTVKMFQAELSKFLLRKFAQVRLRVGRNFQQYYVEISFCKKYRFASKII